ncbi:MAG: RNA polymerase sigma factor (sigma-70 family) [Verrucomicrobiales bacterium]|jgi:RNA polymerase sigma factor (sigma-70 family)
MLALTSPVDLSKVMPASDAEVRREAALDECALELMLREYGGMVKGTLMQRYTTAFGAADVDDVMAIAVERVWRNRDKFDPKKGGLKAWFFRIADNVARDVLRVGWYKARKLEVIVAQGALDGMAVKELTPQSADAGESGSQQKEISRQLLLEVLGKLPEAQRRILWADALSPSGPVPTVDLARELNLSRGTVRVYRTKALARLRKELAGRPEFQHLAAASTSTEGSA